MGSALELFIKDLWCCSCDFLALGLFFGPGTTKTTKTALHKNERIDFLGGWGPLRELSEVGERLSMKGRLKRGSLRGVLAGVPSGHLGGVLSRRLSGDLRGGVF